MSKRSWQCRARASCRPSGSSSGAAAPRRGHATDPHAATCTVGLIAAALAFGAAGDARGPAPLLREARERSEAAIEAERNGITQKRRITEHLGDVIRQELGDANGYHARSLGVLGAINQI